MFFFGKYFIVMFCISLYLSNMAFSAGKYEGKLVVEVMDDGRNLMVLQKFEFVDEQGVRWTVPKGTRTDGASVPRFFWSLFPPFTGQHRVAAVVHDRYCQTRNRPWRKVHRMFYDALLAAGVGPASAKSLYGAVYAFGPRWGSFGPVRSAKMSKLSLHEEEKAFEVLRSWINKQNPTPEEISRYVNRTRLRELGTNFSE